MVISQPLPPSAMIPQSAPLTARLRHQHRLAIAVEDVITCYNSRLLLKLEAKEERAGEDHTRRVRTATSEGARGCWDQARGRRDSTRAGCNGHCEDRTWQARSWRAGTNASGQVVQRVSQRTPGRCQPRRSCSPANRYAGGYGPRYKNCCDAAALTANYRC